MALSVDVVCVGGGVMGLMTAYELAERNVSVAVLDKGERLAAEASWAGAGIVPPASMQSATTAYDRLRAVSFARFPALAEELDRQTGIDIGWRHTGGIELSMSSEEDDELRLLTGLWSDQGIDFESVSPGRLHELEPELSARPMAGYWFRDMWQVRNPRLMRALTRACAARGVALLEGRQVVDFNQADDRVTQVRLADGSAVECGAVVVTAGAWTGELLRPLGHEIPVRPVQGQMLALRTTGRVVRHIVLAGKRYFVPRDDGIVLVGSTEDDVGFDKQVTPEGIEGLRLFAGEMFAELATAPTEASWAGLRPGTPLEAPIIGKVPGWSNGWLATGHFRQGLQLSPGTARLLADWITGSDSFASVDAFASDADRSAFRSGFRS